MLKCKNEDRIEEIKKLWEEGQGNRKIAKVLDIPRSTLKYLCDKYGLKRHTQKQNRVELSKFQKEAIIGMILGDAFISYKFQSSSINFAHSLKQKEYLLHKVDILYPIETSFLKEYQRPNKKTGNTEYSITYTSRSYLDLRTFRDIFYPEGIKVIPIEYLKEHFTAVSLAYMYMDDGNYTQYSTTIATCGFEEDNIQEFISILKEKFDIDFTIQKTKSIRIKQKDINKFFDIVEPYIHDSMKYKTKNLSH